jgi:mannose-1-phosphate guanylyltransferase
MWKTARIQEPEELRHAVIMAGGSGTRLWPLSRAARPKQLLRLFEGRSLLREAFERLRTFLEPAQIYVIANRDYTTAMAADVPELPAENWLAEPCARDTANAVGLAAHLLARRDPQGTMGVFTADQIIRPADAFRRTLETAYAAAERFEDALVTFGVKPTSPHTGYGYVRRGAEQSPGVYEVREFKEKPDRPTAERYLAGGEYCWNAGMFAWRIATILAQFQKHQPELTRGLAETAAQFGLPEQVAWVLERFSRQQRISIDYAIMEKADRVIMVEMDCQWLDVGSWTSLEEIIAPDESGNTRAAPNVVTLDARGNVLVSETDHLIAAIGVEDLVVVHADDATLICRKQDAQRIKDIVALLKSTGNDRSA